MPNSLPSYHGLPVRQRDSVRFTQSKMEYNMGWLVQARAMHVSSERRLSLKNKLWCCCAKVGDVFGERFKLVNASGLVFIPLATRLVEIFMVA
eukprot:6453116-Amphidinium_carterae.1